METLPTSLQAPPQIPPPPGNLLPSAAPPGSLPAPRLCRTVWAEPSGTRCGGTEMPLWLCLLLAAAQPAGTVGVRGGWRRGARAGGLSSGASQGGLGRG